MKKLVLILFALGLSLSLFSQEIVEYKGHKIEANKVIFKYRPSLLKRASQSSVDNSRMQVATFLNAIGAEERQKYPVAKMPENCAQCVDIRQIYEFRYTADVPMEYVLAKLNGMPCIEYAEPSYVGELLYTPDDPEYTNGNLWHLNTCKVLDAWDVEQGDPSVVVAVVDAGIDIIHSDLINRIAYNTEDPINGVDDDGDGFVDNYRGWDVAGNDNNPSNSSLEHGTHVAGISNAEVGNGIGTAGVGYNTKFLPIKICPDGASSVTAGYDGIVYAANHDCKVINCSWGMNAFSSYEYDIVKYATFNCDALIVAAAGNSANTEELYPASFPEVLSVGGTVSGDYVWYNSATSGTNYNRFIDICAPAKGYHSLTNNDKVLSMSGGGTSFSAPIVSGVAALVRSNFPEMTALQVSEQLRMTSDDIYALNPEEMYVNRLGIGRVNAYKALTNTSVPGIRIKEMTQKVVSDKPHISADDEIEITVTFVNYLANASNVELVVSVESSLLQPVKNDEFVASFRKNDEKTITFSFKATEDLPAKYKTYLKFSYSADDDYSSYEYVNLELNTNYFDFELGNIKSTATQDGSIAVYEIDGAQNGFQYKNYGNCIYQAGIVMAESQSAIFSRNYWNANFTTSQAMDIVDVDSCDLMITSAFSANDLLIREYLYGWNDDDALMYEFRIENQRDDTVTNLRFGTFIDWDMDLSSYNKIWYVDSLRLSVAASVLPGAYYVGIIPLDSLVSNVYAFDVNSDVIYYLDGFNKNELWYILNNSQKSVAANSATGAEVAMFHYSLVDTIFPQDSAIVRMALIAADTPEELYLLASKLKQKYTPTIITEDTTVAIASVEKNLVRLCNNHGEYKVIYPRTGARVAITVSSLVGTVVEQIVLDADEQTGEFVLKHLPMGVYVVVVQQNDETTTFKMIVD